jgi:SRSO17 transposase
VKFATEPAQGLAMLERALDAGLPAKWVTADEAYGKDSKFRLGLQRRHVSYVLAVACNQKIPTESGSSRADTLAARAADSAWKRRRSHEVGVDDYEVRAPCPDARSSTEAAPVRASRFSGNTIRGKLNALAANAAAGQCVTAVDASAD